jgi:hypothetical protein
MSLSPHSNVPFLVSGIARQAGIARIARAHELVLSSYPLYGPLGATDRMWNPPGTRHSVERTTTPGFAALAAISVESECHIEQRVRTAGRQTEPCSAAPAATTSAPGAATSDPVRSVVTRVTGISFLSVGADGESDLVIPYAVLVEIPGGSARSSNTAGRVYGGFAVLPVLAPFALIAAHAAISTVRASLCVERRDGANECAHDCEDDARVDEPLDLHCSEPPFSFVREGPRRSRDVSLLNTGRAFPFT